MPSFQKHQEGFLYTQVIDYVKSLMSKQYLLAGHKLPSLRKLSAQLDVSVPTIQQAYEELERQGFVESRPKSGFYVIDIAQSFKTVSMPSFTTKPRTVRRQSLIEQVYQLAHAPRCYPFGISSPTRAQPCDKALDRTHRRITNRKSIQSTSYAPVNGEASLRQQIAEYYFSHGLVVDPEHIVITNGAQEAIAIALMSVAKAGDVIAVESPTYFGILELIESLGMMALEIPACPNTGLCLQDLEVALAAQPVKAAIICTAINNPLGSLMTNQKRKLLVELLEKQKIPLIEDDVYSDLAFTKERPTPAQYYSKKGIVMTCSSFSKTTAPGYRTGWVISEKYYGDIHRLKRSLSCSSSLLHQKTLAEFMATGEFRQNIKRLKNVLITNRDRTLRLLQQHMPLDIRISEPQGGSVFWIELPKNAHANALFERLAQSNIAIAPGTIFSPSGKFNHFFRMTFGLPWDDIFEENLIQLSEGVKKYLQVL
ncbi:MAG: PLP-dependent aminotransferase family protein [Pseudomonadota bacterium]